MKVPQQIYSKEYFETECGGHEDWHSTHGERIEPRLSYPLELARIKKGMKVLDYGCGRGELTWHMANMGAVATGMDYSKGALALAKKLPKKRGLKMQFVYNNKLKLPIESNSLDRILYIDVLEHMYPQELQELLPEFKRVLKKDGQVILHTAPNREFYDYGYPLYTRWISKLINPLYRLVFGEWLITRKDPRRPYDHKVHINESSMQEVKKDFEEAGFKKIKLWYSSKFRDIRVRDHIRYNLLQPQYGFLKRYFCYDIWGIITK